MENSNHSSVEVRTRMRWLVARSLVAFALVALGGCDLSPVKDGKALAQVQSVGVCLVASRFVRLDGNVLHGVSLTKDSPTLYVVLLGNHVEALDSAIRSNRSQGLSLERIESLIEDVSSLNAASPEEYAKQKLDEERIFSNHEARRDSSLRLALKYSKDAILWILVNYDMAKKPAAQYYKGPLSPVVFGRSSCTGETDESCLPISIARLGPTRSGTLMKANATSLM